MKRKILLTCGIISSLLYSAMNVFVAQQWEEYSSKTQTVSELSAVDAPTRSLWVPLGIAYTLLVAMFGWGVRIAAPGNRSLRISGSFLVVYGMTGLAWPLFPMHLRQVLAAGGATWTDPMHIAFTSVTVLLMMFAMGFGAAALNRSFRMYSVLTILVLFTFGMLTGRESPGIAVNGSTPWIGVHERIIIGVYLLWVAVLAIMLLRRVDVRE